ncbi:MAG: multi-sensor hybrid histidine kinase [Cyanobacteria bacterium RYN_339]|nr:multi-sensor hybrid histidine kinase [Cyanobacteria bacterium RYN_339]
MLAEMEALAESGSWDWEVKTDRLHWSRGLHLVYGIPDTPINCLDDYLAIMTPARRAAFKRVLDKALADHQSYVFESWIERANGERRYVRGNGRVLLGADGQPERMVGTVQDLTERHLAAQALQASESKLRAIVEASPDLVIIRDFEGNYLMFNDNVPSSLGVTRERLMGLNIRDVFEPATIVAIEASDGEVMAGGKAVRTELDATTKAGKKIRFESTKYPYVLPSGEPAGIISISRDVTELRELEGLLHRRNEEFKAFVENSPDVISRLDRQHRFVYVNPGSLAGIGVEPAHMLGKTMRELAASDDHTDAFERDLDRVFATGDELLREVEYDTAVGRRWYQSRMFPERSPDGQVAYVLISARDVTEAKTATLLMEEQKALLERIVAYSPFGVAYLDHTLVFRWLNPTFAQLFARPIADFQDRKLADVFAGVATPGLQRALDTGELVALSSYPAPPSKGSLTKQTYWDVSYVPVPGIVRRVEGLLVFAQDVSPRVESEHLRAAQLKRLQELDEFRRVLVSAVSHELRTPLTSVVGYAEFLEDEIAGALNPEQRAFLAAIKGGVFRLRRIVDDLLDVDRLENGTFKLDPSPLDFIAELEDTLKELRPQIEANAIEVEVTAPEGKLVADIDPSRIGQVLVNLLSNALKFTPSHGRIRVAVERESGQLICRIQDSGDGIRPDDLPKLFLRFGQLAEGAQKGGTGLGLFISKALVEAHGGQIGVESSPGAGSTFWFTLPLAGVPQPGQRRSGS